MPRIHQFDAYLRKAGRSPIMRRKVLTNIKTMLTFAQAQGLVAQNVALGVKIKNSERQSAHGPLREGRDFPSRSELSELRGLKWDNVDLDKSVIHVRQRADAWSAIGKPKSKAGNRDIPLTPMLVNTLREWHKACPGGRLNLVFPNTVGKHREPSERPQQVLDASAGEDWNDN